MDMIETVTLGAMFVMLGMSSYMLCHAYLLYHALKREKKELDNERARLRETRNMTCFKNRGIQQEI